MSSQKNPGPGLLPVALPSADGTVTLMKPVRVIEELPQGTHCAGVQVGTLRFFGENDAVGTPAAVGFKAYLTAYAAAAKAEAPAVNLTGRPLSEADSMRAFLLGENAPRNHGAALPVVYLTMGLDDGIKRREMVAFPRIERDADHPEIIRVRDMTTGISPQVSFSPTAFAKAASAAAVKGMPFVNAAYEAIKPMQALITIMPVQPSSFMRSSQAISA